VQAVVRRGYYQCFANPSCFTKRKTDRNRTNNELLIINLSAVTRKRNTNSSCKTPRRYLQVAQSPLLINHHHKHITIKEKPTIEAVLEKKPFLRLPVVPLGAEYLVMGQLMRSNILPYEAPSYSNDY